MLAAVLPGCSKKTSTNCGQNKPKSSPITKRIDCGREMSREKRKVGNTG